jgi:protocatechuate 4,5-dioxygenase beta chain
VAEIVGAIGVPHRPALPAEVAREGPTHEVAQLFRAIRAHLDELRPDALIIFTADHLNTFFLDNLPLLTIGVSDHTEGPNDGTPALPRYHLNVNEKLAQHVRVQGIQHCFDFGVTQEFEVDHSVLVPLHFLTPAMHVPIVPIFIGGIVPPLPLAQRCFSLGQMLVNALRTFDEPLRVALLASGSISLDIGGPLAPHDHLAGPADPAWVNEVTSYLRDAQLDALLNAATADRLARAGNVAGELLNWIALLGALGPRRPVMLEPRPAQGEGFAVWRCDR